MSKVVMYSTPTCPFCHAAKALLNAKGIEYEDIDVMADPQRRQEMMQKAHGRRTVPQIFVGDIHVGGNDDLQSLERQGKLDPLLEAMG